MTRSPAGGRTLEIPVLLLCAAGFAAPAQVASPAQQGPFPPDVIQRVEAPEEELEEVVVSAAKRVRSPKAMLAWLGRLVGEHSYEGHMEFGGAGVPQGRQRASGAGKCIPLGEGAVLCEIHVWSPIIEGKDGNALPDGVPLLSPAAVVYAYDPAIQDLRSLQVDSRGVANGGRGELRGDTLTTTTACVNTPGNCLHTSRVRARADGMATRIEIEIVRDFERVAHYVFESQKVAEAPAIPRELSPASSSNSGSPGERRSGEQSKMEAWLRRMVGRFYQFEYITINGILRNHYIGGRMPDGSIVTVYGDCDAIGSGPGVLCIHYAVQQEPGQEATYHFQQLVLLGMDPNASKIRMLTVVQGGEVMEAGAGLVGNTASWMGTSCRNFQVGVRCQRTMKIAIPPDDRYMVWSNGSRIGSRMGSGVAGRDLVLSTTVYLSRISPEDGSGPDGLPRIMSAPRQEVDTQRNVRSSRPR